MARSPLFLFFSTFSSSDNVIQNKVGFDHVQDQGSIHLADGFGVLSGRVLVSPCARASLPLLLILYFLDDVDVPVSWQALHSWVQECSICLPP